jgi:site-specific DNA-cytosine methylase
MKILELFKGSGSITKYFENKKDVEVISLDILKKFEPTICCDIMEFDYKKYEIGYFDIIWASPECKIFSILQYTHIGKKWKNREELDKEREKHKIFINKTIEIIDYLKPKKYFIENPRYSAIWKYINNKDYLNKYIIVDYCRFGTDYKKPTKILTNVKKDNVLCLHTKAHKYNIGIISKSLIKNKDKIADPTNTLIRYSIPQGLLDYLFI